MSTRDNIIRKAYLCIDEVYPDSTNQDMPAFNIDEFIDQAARIVIMLAPTRALGAGTDMLKHEELEIETTDDGMAVLSLPSTFKRLISICANEWPHSVNVALDSDSPKYLQQGNKVLRGSLQRPVVFLLEGNTKMEVYSVKKMPIAIDSFKEFKGLLFDKVDDNYPEKLHDITAWKTAELVLSTFNNIEAAQMCQNHVQEILQSL